MEIVSAALHRYLDALLPARPPQLQEMEALARERNFPIVGPQAGRVLYQYAKLIGARRVFEMGSGFGYSAFWLALALPEDGKLICTDASQNNLDLAEDYLAAGGLRHKVELLKGDALKILQQHPGPFDLIFNDVDKEDYPRVLELALARLRPGGLLISDNALFHGRVTQENPNRSTAGILAYNQAAFHSPQLWTTILPVRDGLAVSLKLSD
ncbi:MAG: O-methyltransferase [candidate division KSB1 bacterium]|nr:O-methyltransferase [candidate division KSB1 bacterium]MDZ7274620.1 O-methyltransferase [candidate division KSB1 bacterium]MDZ7285445.1 O-methyltransferase [candidate division KSB1 bacterium]MDZ7298477.1 O-methyltransferase [candidate division KSB1 bacterium]MDZ7306961.1 O-methyltransferase [candidate division KSB1 bacterium]